MQKGIVFNIQKFSVNDGPGIRTTVFMKGCPLDCIWCHNPESKLKKPEVFFDATKCVCCERCRLCCSSACHEFLEKTHWYHREDCIMCGECVNQCYSGALEMAGYETSVSEVISEVMKDKAFYDNSGGGLTVSGGEPMYQFSFLYALLKAAKESGLHICLETCGFANEEQYRKIAPLVDIFLFDYKETDSKKHQEFTGVSNELILKNLFLLDELGCRIILRCPIIPTLNDRTEHFEGIAGTANQLKNILEINIEPYHPLGSSKAEHLGKEYLLQKLSFPEEEVVNKWIRMVAEKTDVTVKKA